MEKAIRLASRFYRLLLKMYPPGFRKKFGEEAVEVFTLAISQAGSQGWFRLIGLFFRELAVFPMNLIHEHLHELAVEVIFDRLISSQGRLLPMCLGALGFGSGFAVMSLIQGYVETSFSTGQTLGLSPGRIIPAFARIFAAGLGGLSLGLAIDYKNCKRFAIVGAASYPFMIFLAGRIYHTGVFLVFLVDQINHTQNIAAIMRQPGSISKLATIVLGWFLLGVIAKAFLGYVQIGWNQLPRFILAGAFGILLGFLANRLSAALMQSYLRYPGWPNLPLTDGSFWYFLFKVGPNLLFGAVVGAWLGLAASQVRIKSRE